MSVWQTPVPTRRTSTSPAFGSSSSTSCTTSGSPNASSTAALILTVGLPLVRVCAPSLLRPARGPVSGRPPAAAARVDVPVVVAQVVRRPLVDVGHLAAVAVLPGDLDV